MEAIKNMFALAPMYPNGQKCDTAIIAYENVIQNDELTAQQFTVEDRTVLKVYANDKPERSNEGKDGNYVIIELSIHDPLAAVIVEPPRVPGKKGPPPPKYRRVPSVNVCQSAPIRCADGSTIAPWIGFQASTESIEPVVDAFQANEFNGLQYYLYIPENYDPEQKCPLVLFMTDIGANGTDYRMSLSQGIGGTVWATPEEQAKHPCFVLVPQFPFMGVMRDDFTYDPIFLKIKPLLDHVLEQYSVDTNRIYTTGQSQGCMASCELNVQYPDLFAASLLVAGQWNPETMKKVCAKHNYWIVISELDSKAHPGMDAVTDALREAGAKVAKYTWDAKASKEEMRANTDAAMKDDVNIRYTYLAGDSVLPPEDNGPNRLHHVHSATWPVAYDIEGIRDWMFTCKKEG